MTVDNMITNHIGPDRPVYVRGDGYGFGLGFGVLTNSAEAADALSIGSYTWGRRLRHALLGGSGRGSHWHSNAPDQAVQPFEHPTPLLERGDSGSRGQSFGSGAKDHGAADAALSMLRPRMPLPSGYLELSLAACSAARSSARPALRLFTSP